MALDVLVALQATRVVVPDDGSVIAFDDSPLARISNPPLTGITHPIYEAGVAAARTALRLIDDLPLPSVDLHAQLTRRSSHGRPASDRH